jgi:hypothetical protein
MPSSQACTNGPIKCYRKGVTCRPPLWVCRDLLNSGDDIDPFSNEIRCISCRGLGGNHKGICLRKKI